MYKSSSNSSFDFDVDDDLSEDGTVELTNWLEEEGE